MPDSAPSDETVEHVARALERLGRAIGRPMLRFGVATVDAGAVEQLWPVEAAAVHAAVPSRRAEFASGRALLRRTMGLDVAVPIGPDRRPVLPAGVAASVAHDAELVVVVVAPVTAGARRTLGIDVERTDAVDAALAPVVVRADEGPLDPTLVFCAKEAAYKAWSMAGGRFLEHHDVRIVVDGATLHAEVVHHHPADPCIALHGGWVAAAGRYLTVIAAEPVPAARDSPTDPPADRDPSRKR